MRPRHDDEDELLKGSRDDGGDPWGRTLVVERELAGVTLDRFLASSFPSLDHGYLRQLVREGRVRVDGVAMMSSRKLWRNAVVSIDADVEDDVKYQKPEELPVVDICYEDADVAIVNKPPGLILDQRNLAQHVPSLSAPKGDLVRLVEKMEKSASGLMILTKNLEAHRAVEKLMESGAVIEEVLAICEGQAGDEDSFAIADPIGTDERRTGRREVNGENAEPAETRVTVQSRYDHFTVVVAIPVTHRTHQVRVHLQSAGLPIAGDPYYGRNAQIWVSDLKRGYSPKPGATEKPVFARTAMFVQKIQFTSPAGCVAMAAAAPPADFERFLKSLERYRSTPRGTRHE